MKRQVKYLTITISMLFAFIFTSSFINVCEKAHLLRAPKSPVNSEFNLKKDQMHQKWATEQVGYDGNERQINEFGNYPPINQQIDHGFLTTLSAAGIYNACQEMNIDFKEVFAPLATKANNPYRQYRWSVSRDEHGNPVIHALPPEEEMGWTPWERWSMKNNKPVRTAWVLYPVKEPIERGIVRWYHLEESENLTPRFMHKTEDIEALLRLSRIDEAADWLGIDFKKVLIDALKPAAQKIYAQYRWVVIPHTLAMDGPVIYALPPMDKSDDWPWESWYTDGTIPVIHHVHYTREKPNTMGSWSEGTGAPQRPPEIFHHTWYWYNDIEMLPAMSKID